MIVIVEPCAADKWVYLLILPAIYIFLAIPTPPETINEPSVLVVDCVVSVIFVIESTISTVPEPCDSILIFELLPDVVISITPAEVISIPPALEVTCNAFASVPVELNIKLDFVCPVIPIVKCSASPSVANVIFDASPTASILNDLESSVIAVLVILPIPTVPEPCDLILIFELLSDVVISMTPSEVISIPPALAVTCKASVPVPEELNTKLESVDCVNSILKSWPSVLGANFI